MIVYSTKIIGFIAEIKRALKCILMREVGLRVHSDRFYDKMERFSYPIKVVIYCNKRMLGYFASDFFELGFHERLMYVPKEQLYDIIRHEIAHYLTYIQHGEGLLPHGVEFRKICENFGWGESVYKATTCLDDGSHILEPTENSILRKVQKLMALSSSSNAYEAEQAMLKSQELLLKHNLDPSPSVDDERVVMARVLMQKKESAKMRAIANILDTFFVTVVFSRAQGAICLEIVGSQVNVEIAEYVAHFLDIELEKQWEDAKKKHRSLKGMVAKNSFFLGIAKGYCEKVAQLKRSYSSDISRALLACEKKLVDVKAMVYPRLRYSRSSAGFCSTSSSLGQEVGSALTINPAIRSPATQSGAYLT